MHSARADAVPPAHETSNVVVTVWRPAPGLFASRVVGRLDASGAQAIAVQLRQQIAEDKHHVGFHDWSEMSDYQTAAREILTDVTREHLPSIRAAHVFVESRLVAFGVRAANIALKRLTVHTSRDAFEAALTAAIEATRTPSSRPRPRFD